MKRLKRVEVNGSVIHVLEKVSEHVHDRIVATQGQEEVGNIQER